MSALICYDSNCEISNKLINNKNLHQGHNTITMQELKLIVQNEQEKEYAHRSIRKQLFNNATTILNQLIVSVNDMKKQLLSLKKYFGNSKELQKIAKYIEQCEVSEEQEIFSHLSSSISDKIKNQNNKIIWESKITNDINTDILTFVASVIVKSLCFEQFSSIDKCSFSDQIKQDLIQLKNYMQNLINQCVSDQAVVIEQNNYQLTNKMHNWQPYSTLKVHTQPITAIAYNNKQQLFASGSYDTTIVIWSCKQKIQKETVLYGHKEKVCCLDFCEEKNLLASSGYDKDIYFWDINNLQCQPIILKGHLSCVNRIQFRNDSFLVSVSNDEKIIIWSLFTYQPLKILTDHQGSVTCVAFSLSQPYFGTSGSDMKVILWEITNFTKFKEIQFKHECFCIEFNDSNKQQLLIASGQHFIEVWNYMKAIKLSRFDFLTNSIWSHTFSPSKQQVLVSTETGILILDSGLKKIHQQIINQACSFNQILLTEHSQLIFGDKNGNLHVQI